MAQKRRFTVERLEARYALAGDLDPTFGTGGIVEVELPSSRPASEQPVEMVRQPDGKVVVAGTAWSGHSYSFALRRFDSSGAIDTSFGENGVVVTSFAGDARVLNLAMQSDGKILVAYTDQRFVRYHVDGTIDATFGVDGTSVNLGQAATIIDLAVTQDDKILLFAGTSGWNRVIRLTRDGEVDPTFSEQLLGGNYGGKIVEQSDGKILVAASLISNEGDHPTGSVKLMRFEANGGVDYSFVQLQTATGLDLGGRPSPISLAVQPDGKPVISTILGTSGDYQLGVIRFNANGTLDSVFGDGGISRHAILDGVRQDLPDIAILPDGKMVASGVAIGGPMGEQQFFVRLLPDGALDESWDNDGVLIQVRRGVWPTVSDLLPQPDGGLLALIEGRPATGESSMGVLALNESGDVDASFGDAGFVDLDLGGMISIANEPKVFEMPDGGLMVLALRSGGDSDPVLLRYRPGGELDTAFGDEGMVVLKDLAAIWLALDGVVMPNGEFVVLCRFGDSDPLPNFDIGLLRVRADGTLNTNFGIDGVAKVVDRRFAELPRQIALDDNGNIVVAGNSTYLSHITPEPGITDRDPIMAMRFLSNGVLDQSYGENGIALHHFERDGRPMSPESVAIQPDGSVVFANQLHAGDGLYRLVLRKFDPQGSLDQDFGVQGVLTLVSSVYRVGQVHVFADGVIQLAGIGNEGAAYYLGVWRFAADGSPLAEYGDQGFALVYDYTGQPVSNVTPSGRPAPLIAKTLIDGSVIVGITEARAGDDTLDIYIAHVTPNGQLDVQFGNAGTTRLAFSELNDSLYSVVMTDAGLVTASSFQTGRGLNLALARLELSVAPSVWQNPENPLNVDGDSEITPLDALIIINQLNAQGGGRLNGAAEPAIIDAFFDVDGDYFLTPLDALIVINWLNANPPGSTALSAADSPVAAEGESDTPLEGDWFATLDDSDSKDEAESESAFDASDLQTLAYFAYDDWWRTKKRR